ncbi:hypothetical protein AOLI_G00110710 [Acnodon oligacanthus]
MEAHGHVEGEVALPWHRRSFGATQKRYERLSLRERIGSGGKPVNTDSGRHSHRRTEEDTHRDDQHTPPPRTDSIGAGGIRP